MKLNYFFKMETTGQAILILAFALLSVQALHGVEFFDDSILRGANTVTPNIAHRGDSIINRVSNNNPIQGAIDFSNLSFSGGSDVFVAEAARQASFEEVGADFVPVPKPAAAIGLLGLAGFIGYRERRRVRSLWSGHVVPGIAFVCSLAFGGLVALARMCRPRISSR